MGNLLKWGVVTLASLITLGAVVNAKRAKARAKALGEKGLRAADKGRQSED